MHVLQHLGGGIAPWNVQQYHFSERNSHIIGQEITTGKEFEAVFFHFHGLKFYDNNIVSLTHWEYELSSKVIDLFFKPYVKALMSEKNTIFKFDTTINANGSSGEAPFKQLNFDTLKKYYFVGLKKSKRNIFGMHLFKRIKHHYFVNTLKF